MEVLVIAPKHDDLPNAEQEIIAIKKHHPSSVVLRGTVRESDISSATDEKRYDVIWFISHGSRQGVLLSDGALSISGVSSYVRESGANLCVLNTCEGEEIARDIAIESLADVIYAISTVSNSDAIRLGVSLARALPETNSYREAYQSVGASNGEYRYIAAAGDGTRRRQIDLDSPRIDRVEERQDRMSERQEKNVADIQEIRSSIEQIRSALYSSIPGQPGVFERLRRVDERVDGHDRLLQEISLFIATIDSRLTRVEVDVRDRIGPGRTSVSTVFIFLLVLGIVALSLIIAGLVVYLLYGGKAIDGRVGAAVLDVLYLADRGHSGLLYHWPNLA